MEIRLKASNLDSCEGDKTFGSEHWSEKDRAMTNGHRVGRHGNYKEVRSLDQDAKTCRMLMRRQAGSVNCHPEGDG